MALAIAGAASDKKALDIVIMKMRKMSSVCDYFVIASGTSTTHVRALSDNITKKLKEKGQSLWHSEGEREASWILLDFGDVVCHLFLKETRVFYNLEGLWGKAPQEHFDTSTGSVSTLSKRAIAKVKRARRRVEEKKPGAKRAKAKKPKKVTRLSKKRKKRSKKQTH